MKAQVMKKIVMGIAAATGLVGVVGLNSCTTRKSDPDTERKFHGQWRTEYYVGNKDMRMKVSEKADFDTLTHKYRITQVQELVYPVNIVYAEVAYEGTWKADDTFLIGKIDASTVKNELNPLFDEHKEFKVYQDFVKDEAESDMKKDEFLIRKIEDDRIHLYDEDRKVAHDLIRRVQAPEDTDHDIVI